MSQLLQSIISDSSSISRQNPLATAAAATAVGAAFVYSARAIYRATKLPKGPWGLPFIGQLPWIDADHFEEALEKLRLQHGPIFSFRAGQRLMVVVSSQELLKQMLNEEVFAGRMVPPQVKDAAQGCGIVFTEQQTWKEQRRVCLRVMRDFGFGKKESINTICEEVTDILHRIESQQKNVETFRLFTGLSNTTVAMLLFGRRYANEDPRFELFINDLTALLQEGLSGSLTLLFPTFAPLLKLLNRTTKRAAEAAENVKKFIEEEIANRESQLTDPNAEPLCLCDAYIQERRLAEARGDYETYKPFHLVRVCMEMFIAGTDTTARSLEWLLLHMSLNPHSQDKVQREIDDVVGRERRPQMLDRDKLHYTLAVIDESLRLASLTFNGVPHRAVRDAEFHGYTIPADAAIIPFVYGAHRDSSVWDRPHDFHPQHFLDQQGRYTPSKNLVSFLVGKRVCPGESLAKLEIFHAFTAVMQRYSVELSESCRQRKDDILRGETTSALQAAEHTVDFHERF